MVLVVGALSRLATMARRIPAVRRIRASRARRHDGLNDAHRLGAVDQCRTAALVSLAGDNVTARALLASPRIERSARRVSLVASGRRRTDVFRVDHAYARDGPVQNVELTFTQLESSMSYRLMGDGAPTDGFVIPLVDRPLRLVLRRTP